MVNAIGTLPDTVLPAAGDVIDTAEELVLGGGVPLAVPLATVTVEMLVPRLV